MAKKISTAGRSFHVRRRRKESFVPVAGTRENIPEYGVCVATGSKGRMYYLGMTRGKDSPLVLIEQNDFAKARKSFFAKSTEGAAKAAGGKSGQKEEG